MDLNTGTQLGLCEITSLLWKGGMGEVYRARDTKLKRDVAIKVLPEVFADDPGRMKLGPKLEMQKRSYPGLVIDHIEEKPTDH